jgi:ADP-ribose pyrophosphatase YjhB (NUDIX family)
MMKSPSFSKRIPPGDQKERLVCDACGWVHYQNPKVVVGAVATHEARYLLCRRAIEPSRGLWTITAGYLEEQETPEQGALREAHEEARVELQIEGLLGVYSIARISQIQLLFKATLARPEFEPGEESLEVRLFDWSEIPWSEIAFPSVRWALERHRAIGDQQVFATALHADTGGWRPG